VAGRVFVVVVVAICAVAGPGILRTAPSEAAGSGVYSSPSWLPIKSALIGCAYQSPGGSCGGYHTWWAIDFGAPIGRAVYAAGAGQLTVVRSGNTGCSATANAVRINHGSSRYTYYTHLGSISVANGAWVDQYTKIGTVGTTGLASEGCWPHLHFERRTGTTQATAVNPGALSACRNGSVITYPSASGGGSSWQGIAGHQYSVASDGPWCSNTVIKSAANGKYVAAEISGVQDSHLGRLRARSSSVGSWERFKFIGDCSSSTGCAIRSSANGKYVTPELTYAGNYTALLRARSTTVGTSQRFVMAGDCRSTKGCAIKARANGRYTSAELNFTGGNYGLLRARATSVGGWERFRLG
jgi:hypothetical protein